MKKLGRFAIFALFTLVLILSVSLLVSCDDANGQFVLAISPTITDICTISGSGVYNHNAKVTIELSDLFLGYDFLGWYNGDTLLSTERSYTLKIPANDLLITAKLAVKEEMKIFEFYSTPDSCMIMIDRRYGKSITNVVIPDYVTDIYSFKNCPFLENIVIPNSVTSIVSGAFNGCSALANITIPDSVTNIGINAFYGTAWYDNQPDGLVYAGKVAYDYKGTMPNDTSIKIKEGTIGIAGGAFAHCDSLTSITIPDSVMHIGASAFYNCTGLTNITIPDSVMSIDVFAFAGCSNLASIVIGNSVTSIDPFVFDGRNNLTSIIVNAGNIKYHSSDNCLIETETKTLVLGCQASIIPSDGSVISISGEAFRDCIGLSHITIPDSVTSIGSGAFSGTAWYNNQPDGLVYAGKVAYKYKGTMPSNTSIEIKEGTLGIAEDAFEDCIGLVNITIPDSVINIGKDAFSGCSSLTTVFYAGTEEQWKAISIGSDNSRLTSATRYYYSETEPALNSDGTGYDGNYWHYDTDGVTIIIWKKSNKDE